MQINAPSDREHMRLLLAARKSTKIRDTDGRELDPINIDTQDKRGREWAERHGHTVIDVAADVRSGRVAPWDRPNLRPWVTDPAKMALYDGILAYKNDRLSRGDWDDEARIRLWAKQHGKVLVIVDGPQWPPRNDGDEWSWEAMAKQAAKEWETNRENTMRALQELRERGKLIGRPPWGYVSVGVKYDHTIVPTDQGRELVPEMFARCIAGESLGKIAAWLDEQTWPGVPFKYQRWWPRTVGTLLRNPTYMGHRCEQDPRTRKYGRTLLTCEPLVDAHTFRLAGEALDGRPKRGPANAKNRAMLAGALFCPRCDDSPMYRILTGTGASTAFYYRCAGRGASRKGCGNMARLAAVDTAVDALIAEKFDEPVKAYLVTPGNNDEIAKRLAEIEFEIKQLAVADLDDEEEDRQRAALRAERDRVKAEPVLPDRVEEKTTGERYADLWARTPANERGPWLAKHKFRVTADRAGVTVERGDAPVVWRRLDDAS